MINERGTLIDFFFLSSHERIPFTDKVLENTKIASSLRYVFRLSGPKTSIME